MKAAKVDYYDPKLKGHQDGNDMDQLPKIVPPAPPKSIQKSPPVNFPVSKIPEQYSDPPTIKKTPRTPKVNSSMHASKIDSALASKQDGLLEAVRGAVKIQGKEVSYVRLTQAEKNQLADIIYSYKRQGIRTSETEVSRIAINYLLEDYLANGKGSILARMLEILKS